ncbi:leucine Rich Repeat [Seminavis robusta]|uniref:Leucine Rich Repeat n=1 Tax=Seminavis robusta TaxID=568900 RepID=A0A9N8HQU9_9STRA|nr:leucine Rich Repeat [Seminavis robusta]|eukprot:Sro1487_g276820.1 leucine Rich Repeat (552) ;mRNA; r:23958-25762
MGIRGGPGAYSISGIAPYVWRSAVRANRFTGSSTGQGTDLEQPRQDDDDDTIAVAWAVEADEEESIQVAQPARLSNKKGSLVQHMAIVTSVACLLVIAMIADVLCGSRRCSSHSHAFRFLRYNNFQGKIEQAFGPSYFQTSSNDDIQKLGPSLTRTRALHWIVFDDPMQLDPDADNLLQRFIMALMHFQTSQEHDWVLCGPQRKQTDDTCWMTIAGVESLTSRWLSHSHECQWAGSFCDGEKNIIDLVLPENGLNGPVPVELAKLSILEKLDLSKNLLTGTIPTSYGSFSALSDIVLQQNKLSGKIPSELFGSKLSVIDFRNNSLTGTVPTEVGLFDGEKLLFGHNSLSGSIPTELFHPMTGTHNFLCFENNMLTGTLPTEIGLSKGYRIGFDFQGNQLHGSLPSEIGLVGGSLFQLTLSNNAVTGTKPEELFTRCRNLYEFDASNCDMTGTISTSLRHLTRLESFDISRNKFLGTIPDQLAALTRLRTIRMNGNKLSSTLPSAVCAQASYFKRFELTADCLKPAGDKDPIIACSCCDVCCDGDTGNCLSQ